MKPSEYLRAAREKIVQHGWTQGTIQDKRGFCALGACAKVCEDRARLEMSDARMYHTAQRALADKCKEIYGRVNVVTVNDTPGRTQQEMLDLFEKAAISLEEKGE